MLQLKLFRNQKGCKNGRNPAFFTQDFFFSYTEWCGRRDLHSCSLRSQLPSYEALFRPLGPSHCKRHHRCLLRTFNALSGSSPFSLLTKRKQSILQCSVFFWCGRRDLNPHDVTHTALNRARLPIPPRPHIHWLSLVNNCFVRLTKNNHTMF